MGWGATPGFFTKIEKRGGLKLPKSMYIAKKSQQFKG